MKERQIEFFDSIEKSDIIYYKQDSHPFDGFVFYRYPTGEVR